MKELIKPLSETIISRSKNPIIGSFSLSWLSFNFKVWTTLIFDTSTSYNSRLSAFVSGADWWSFLIWPFLIGLLVYAITLALQRVTSLVSIKQREFITDKSMNLAAKENQRARKENEGQEYADMKIEKEKAIEQLNVLKPLLDKIANEGVISNEEIEDQFSDIGAEFKDITSQLRVFLVKSVKSKLNENDYKILLDYIDYLEVLNEKKEKSLKNAFQEITAPVIKQKDEFLKIKKYLDNESKK